MRVECIDLLRLPEPRISPVRLEQLVVSPGFYDAAVFQNERLIGSRHGVEPVGDDDRGPSVRQAAERRLQPVLISRWLHTFWRLS